MFGSIGADEGDPTLLDAAWHNAWSEAGGRYYHYLLPTTHYPLPTTYYLLPTTYYYLLPTTYYLPPTTDVFGQIPYP